MATPDLDPAELAGNEVVIGAGVHAAIYCATRVAAGFPKPVVLEKTSRVGGIFARYDTKFWLNSINGGALTSTAAGPSRIRSESAADDLNWLPNCTAQITADTTTEYPCSTVVGAVIRRNLSRSARVYTDCDVTVSKPFGAVPEVTIDGSAYDCGRVIDARGLRMKDVPNAKGGTSVVTADQFLRRELPESIYAGAKRIAVLGGPGNGGGDTANIVVESLLGQGPDGKVIDAAEIGWYAPQLPLTKDEWLSEVHARYMGIGRHMPQASVSGVIRPYRLRTEAFSLGTGARVDGRNYDLAVYCTGFQSAVLGQNGGFILGDFQQQRGLWRSSGNYYLVGPAADLPLSPAEDLRGYSRFPRNTGAIFRLGPETAQLAASLPAVSA